MDIYPPGALQQLTRNAVMHRSYEGTYSPVMVYWFDDRIEIISAGGPFGRVTPETFGKPGYADYRDPSIAPKNRIMKPSKVLRRVGMKPSMMHFHGWSIVYLPSSLLIKNLKAVLPAYHPDREVKPL